jgi:A/G-specific adenine glycosylase
MKKMGQRSKKGALQLEFASILLKWHRYKNKRQMPWKGERDPYKIWLSEIILQQTRVEQGLNYYNLFIKRFPSIKMLAAAPDAEVFKMWEGLGYYTRCRNLIHTARFVSDKLDGRFPDTYDEIKSLKGIGSYTSAAIASFAFNQPFAVVDGNVFRVLSRVFGIAQPIDSMAGRKFFSELAQQLLDEKKPARYNQAIMDFGATVCKPLLPLCSSCPFSTKCEAFLTGRVDRLPVKEKKTPIRKRWFYYFVMEYQNTIAIRQRIKKDIWNQLFEFPMIEKNEESPALQILKEAERCGWIKKGQYEILHVSDMQRQQLSHQLINGQFIRLSVRKKTAVDKDWLWTNQNSLRSLAFPGIVNQYLVTRSYTHKQTAQTSRG